MKTYAKTLSVMLLILAGQAAFADETPRGKALYEEKCAMCHGVMGMGTGLLARRMDTAYLTERTDLTVDFVIAAARTGLGNMPAIPRGEVSDDQLKAIAEFLAKIEN